MSDRRRCLTSRIKRADRSAGVHGEISSLQARPSFPAANAWCLLTAAAMGCGDRPGPEYETRADLDPAGAAASSALDAGQHTRHGDEGSRDPLATRSPETYGSNDGSAHEAMTSPLEETASAAAPSDTSATPSPTRAEPTATSPDETSVSDGPSVPITVPVDGPGSLTGCTEVREELENGCNYILDCDYLSVVSTCRSTNDGSWSCDCFGPVISSEQTLAPMDVSQVCASSAEFCIEEVAPVLSSLVCTEAVSRVDGERCVATSDCQRTTTLADGTAAATHALREVQCFPGGDSELRCSCRDDTGIRSFALEGVGAADSCTVMSALCDRPVSEEESCAAVNVEEGWGCDAECGQMVETDSPAVRARVLNQSASSHCEVPMAGDDWYCSCSNTEPFLNLYPVVSSSLTAEVACLGAVNACRSVHSFEPVGAPQCSEVSFYSDATSCSAGSDCTQPGRLGEYSVGLRGGGGINASCQLTEAGLWQCYCASSVASEYFAVEAATSREACSTSYDTCRSAAHYAPMHDGTPAFVFALPSQDAGAE